MDWWIWMLLGLGLFAMELLVAGAFIFLFFGIAALLVGAGVGVGVLGPLWLQWFFFSLLSVVALVALRTPLQARFSRQENQSVDTVAGEIAVANEELMVGGAGQVEFRGSPWTAKNAGEVPIEKGRRCHVDRIEGLTLWVRPE